MKIAIYGIDLDARMVREYQRAYEVVQVFDLQEGSTASIREQLSGCSIGCDVDRVVVVGKALAREMLPGTEAYKLDRSAGTLYPLHDRVYMPVLEEHNQLYVRRLALSIPVLEYTEGMPTSLQGEYIYLDLETTGLDHTQDTITSLQIGDSEHVWYIANPTNAELDNLYNLVREGCTPVFHNAAFDVLFLANVDERWLQVEFVDTMIMAGNRGFTTRNLKYLVTHLTDFPGIDGYALLDSEKWGKLYSVADIYALRALHVRFMRKEYRPIDRLTFRACKALNTATFRGLRVSRERADTALASLQREKAIAAEFLFGVADINWNSPKQILGVTGWDSTRADYLEKLEDDTIAEALLRYRKADKLIGMFNGFLPEDSEQGSISIHPQYVINGADTGRTSCRHPNIQQINPVIKAAFVSKFEGGCFTSFDLKQAEMRVAALLSGDKAFAQDLRDGDVHKATASTAFGIPTEDVTKEQRSLAKIVNFGALMYGGTAAGIAYRTGAEEQVLQTMVDALQTNYPTLVRWQNSQVKNVHRGYTLDAYQRLRYVGDYTGGRLRRVAMNTPVQALSSHICLEIVAYTQERLTGYQSYVATTVHDSIYVDTHPEEAGIVAQVLQDALEYVNHVPELQCLPGYGLVGIGGDIKTHSTLDDSDAEYVGVSDG